jgi:hypothetical protein
LPGLTAGRWGEKNRAVGRLYLAHALMVSEFMVALEMSCRRHGVRLVLEDELGQSGPVPLQWRVKHRHGTRLGVVPDRAFALEHTDAAGQVQRSWFFLEADRGTMPVLRSNLAQTSIHRKLLAYQLTWANKVHQRHLGIPRFRVLTVTQSPERVQSMLDACRTLERGLGLFLFADLSLMQGDLLTNAWRSGKDGELVSLV